MTLRRLPGVAVLLWCWPLLASPANPTELPRLAIAGELRMGLGGILLRAGLPFDYLTADEQTKPAVLAGYDLIVAAALEESDDFGPEALRAMDSYLREGGHLFCELGWERLPALAMLQAGAMREAREGVQILVAEGDHPWLRELPKDRHWDFRGRVLRASAADPALTVLAVFEGRRRRGAPALVARTWGRGEVYYTPTDLGYRQGNWEAYYDDLVLAAVASLTGGRARPQWAAPAPRAPAPTPPPVTVAPPAYPRLPQASDLGPAPADGYCLRVPVTADRTALVFLEWEPAVRDGLVLEVRGRRAALTSVQQGRAGPPSPATLPDGAGEVVLQRLPERANLVVDGALVATVTRPLQPGRGCFARGAEVLLQPLEPVWFGDDFTGDGHLSGAWHRLSGEWSLSGQTPSIAQVPGFALRGTNGVVSAGQWFWAQYAAEVSVRALDAGEVRVLANCWDVANRLEWRLPVGQGRATLVRVRAGREQVLATAEQALPARQWVRLRLAVDDRLVTASVDGVPVLRAAAEAAMGGIGLGVVGGQAVFDDVRVADARAVAPWPRVHPAQFDKGPAGLLDRDTWSCPAAAWRPERRPHSFRHVGRFGGDFRWVVPWRASGPAPSLVLRAGAQRGAEVPVLAVSGPHQQVLLERRAGRLSALVDGAAVPTTTPPGQSWCLALAWHDLALAPTDLELTAEAVQEYLFDKAPVEWWEQGGEWSVTSRWTCQPQWSWLVGESPDRQAALWHKRPVRGDLLVEAPLGPVMHGNYRPGCELFGRLRLTLCGDGRDPFSGYTIELGTAGRDVCTLYRQGRAVARVEGRLPRWREIHNAWFDLAAERQGADLTVTFHGRPLLWYRDEQPLPDGRICLSTEANGVVTPYVAIYGRLGAPGLRR